MAKGKKFDAAEKHFQGEIDKLRKQIKFLEEDNKQIRCQLIMKEKENAELKTAQIVQQQWIDRLLEYTELDVEDIKQACEKDKRLAEAARMLSCLSNYSGFKF